MKTPLLAAAAVVAGIVVGIGQTKIELRTTDDSSSPPPTAAGEEAPQPKARVVGELLHNFGVMNRNASLEKTWRIENVGNDTLKLTLGSVTCSLCVNVEILNPEIAPGETGEIKVVWSPKVFKPDFQHGAEIGTNDPSQSVIRLQIRGRVTETVTLEPRELSFSGISSDADTELSFHILSYERDDLTVELTGMKHEETRDFFDVQLQELSAEELAQHDGAKRGYKGTVLVKPGLPVGPVTQTIHLATNDELLNEFEVPIRGVINSDISLIGKGGAAFRRDNNTLTLGVVKRAQGAKAELAILVRGESRNDVKLSIGQIDPQQAITAAIGEPNRLEAVTMYPLTVEVPADSPLISRMGPGREKLGKIVIETTHPDAKEVLMLLRFAVED